MTVASLLCKQHGYLAHPSHIQMRYAADWLLCLTIIVCKNRSFVKHESADLFMKTLLIVPCPAGCVWESRKGEMRVSARVPTLGNAHRHRSSLVFRAAQSLNPLSSLDARTETAGRKAAPATARYPNQIRTIFSVFSKCFVL